jgi:hypothetical protein
MTQRKMRKEIRMLTTESGPSANGSSGGNLFVEADPERETLGSPRTERPAASTCSTPDSATWRVVLISLCGSG